MLHLETEGCSAVSEDKEYHADLTKLADMVKDKVDAPLNIRCDYDISVTGLLVSGWLKWVCNYVLTKCIHNSD